MKSPCVLCFVFFWRNARKILVKLRRHFCFIDPFKPIGGSFCSFSCARRKRCRPSFLNKNNTKKVGFPMVIRVILGAVCAVSYDFVCLFSFFFKAVLFFFFHVYFVHKYNRTVVVIGVVVKIRYCSSTLKYQRCFACTWYNF